MSCLLCAVLRVPHQPFSEIPQFGCRRNAFCRAHGVIGSVALALCLLLPGSLVHAQTFYGSISGIVKDPSGAVVPDVAVTVRESTSTTEYKSVTNKTGS